MGRLELADRQPDGISLWRLVGESPFRYLLERSQVDFRWQPFLQDTNESGVLTFPAPPVPDAAVEFYRVRILD